MSILPQLLSFLSSQEYIVKDYNLSDEIIYRHHNLMAIYFIVNDASNITGLEILGYDANNNQVQISKSNDMRQYTKTQFFQHTSIDIAKIIENKNIGMYSFCLNADTHCRYVRGCTEAKIKFQFNYKNDDRVRIIYQYALDL